MTRDETLENARRLAKEWGYWCFYGHPGGIGGRPPGLHTGGIEKQYKTPPQWHPPEPKLPEADENSGMAVQRAFIQLPRNPYRNVLMAEFCLRPWIAPTPEAEVMLARRARVSKGAYELTLERALLALANVMKRQGY